MQLFHITRFIIGCNVEMTNIKLELMTDIDMFQLIEKGMRGDISYIAKKCSKAYNKYMKDYHSFEE